jgi:Nucleotidyl transferase AbiEii toxin, Type IV TA system
MNPAFPAFLAATAEDRHDAFLGAARRMGTTAQNVEKDFWVCWTLDALFNGAAADGPRLLFKGGTSLSKAFGLISRFSEDIDITIFRDDLGQGASVEDLAALSGKKRRARLDAIKAASQNHVSGQMRMQLTAQNPGRTADCRPAAHAGAHRAGSRRPGSAKPAHLVSARYGDR